MTVLPRFEHDTGSGSNAAPFFLPMKRYTTFNNELLRQFGQRIQRVSLDAGFTCPNRDGSVGHGGCTFCGDRGAAAVGVPVALSIAEQLADGKRKMQQKYGAAKFLAYFQAYSNTYENPDRLRRLYEEALADPTVVGLIIGTRPDCLPPATLDLLTELHARTYLWLELGMQTMHDRTLSATNRGHDHACLESAVQSCRERGIRTCAHLVLGLPGESRAEMLASVREVDRLGFSGAKFHHLHILKGSQLEVDYRAGKVSLLERDEYIGLVCDALELLDPQVIIHRLMGDGRTELVAPEWSRRKLDVLNRIDREMTRRDSVQGCRRGEG